MGVSLYPFEFEMPKRHNDLEKTSDSMNIRMLKYITTQSLREKILREKEGQWQIPEEYLHLTMPSGNGSQGSRQRRNGREDQVQKGQGKNTYQGTVKFDKDWNLYSRVSNEEVTCDLTKANFNAVLEAPTSQSAVGWGVIRKWPKSKYRLLFWQKLL